MFGLWRIPHDEWSCFAVNKWNTILHWKLIISLNQSFGLSMVTHCRVIIMSPLEDIGFSLFLLFRLALLWGHSFLWLHFGCCCRSWGGRGRRGGGRGWTPSGLYACACHLQLSSFCKGGVVNTFQKETLSFTTVESLREENDQGKGKMKDMYLTSIVREICCTILPCRWH